MLHPAAITWPPPPNSCAIRPALTPFRLLMLTLYKPFLSSLIATPTLTPSMLTAMSAKLFVSLLIVPVSLKLDCLIVIIATSLFPKNFKLSYAFLVNSNWFFVLLLKSM